MTIRCDRCGKDNDDPLGLLMASILFSLGGLSMASLIWFFDFLHNLIFG